MSSMSSVALIRFQSIHFLLHGIALLVSVRLASAVSETRMIRKVEPSDRVAVELGYTADMTEPAEPAHMIQLKGNKSTEDTVVLRYSQCGQDKWLADLYGKEFKGFYLDIGAHNGVLLSNTQALDERGWKGVCVEPLPKGFENRTCKLFKTVLTDITGDNVTFEDCTLSGSDGGDGGLSGIEGVGKYANGAWRSGCNPVHFQTMRADHFLNTVKEVPKVIDYLSIDVEGSEGKILSHFPWDKHCVRAFTIERPPEELETMLKEHKCVLNATLGEDHAYKCEC